jgi:hypothetical protein
MWRSDRVLGKNPRDRWIYSYLCYLLFSKSGASNVISHLCCFCEALHYTSVTQERKLTPRRELHLGLRCKERKMRSIFQTGI